MCSAQKWMLPYQDLYVGCHYFLGIYHLFPFGSSELHVLAIDFSFKHFVLFIQLYIDLCLHFDQDCIQFHSCIHVIPNIHFHVSIHLYSCIHFHLCFYLHFYIIYDHSCIHLPSCIHFHSWINFIHFQSSLTCIFFKNIYSFQVSFIFIFLHNSELLLKEDNDKYLKLASYQF